MFGVSHQRVALSIIVLLAVPLSGCRGNKNLTKANYDKIAPGMTLAEVEQLLGGPGESEGGDLALAEGSGGAAAVGIGDLQSMSQPRSKTRTYKWGSDKRYIKVIFLDGKVAPANFKSEQGIK